ncbi:hypothetical protein RJ55_07151 [Drechmeria coniospora]|nr:hypothetical protein RJ55_07151 [Drechmeria coniospora]
MQALTKRAEGLVPAARLSPSRRFAGPCPRRKLHLDSVGAAVGWTADGISSMHAAGLPWYLSIPLVAVAVNFSFRLPLQHFTRRLVMRRNELSPLVAAWGSRHAAAVARGADDAAAERVWRLRVAGLTEKSRRRIYKAWRVQRWKTLAPFLSIVPFVVVSEAIRRLCGAPMGWLSHQMGLLPGSTALFHESLAEGGCLWFVDLTAMDPYYALPLLCSALLARTSWGRLSKEQLRALLSPGRAGRPATPVSRLQTAVGRALLLVPLLPVAFADLPSAIFLYWAATFGLNDVNESILSRLIPKQPPKLPPPQLGAPAAPWLRGDEANQTTAEETDARGKSVA